MGLLRTRAERQEDGTYRIFGTKIFITYGENDLTENIVHLMLARLPDAPKGVAGISLFLVPKFLVNPDGSLGARNDIRCVGIEHKLGIKASPTTTLQFGSKGGLALELRIRRARTTKDVDIRFMGASRICSANYNRQGGSTLATS
ncbi:MAG: hypothetical protein QM756_43230 [Polyangiaceae bacterium]